MDFGQIRQQALRLFLGFLALTGVVAIYSVLLGDFGEFQLKILGTCFTLCVGSICAMGCAAYIEKHQRRDWGQVGILTAILSVLCLIYGIWAGPDSDAFWEVTLSLVVIAVAVFHSLLICLPNLDPAHQAAPKVGVGGIVILGAMILAVIWGLEPEDGYFQLLAAVSVVVGLCTVAVPILMRMRTEAAPNPEGTAAPLVLDPVSGDRYRGQDGRLYQVTLVADEASDTGASGSEASDTDASGSDA